jgi:hypothetical protein
MALPPTSSNLLQHALCAHLQIILWKAADQHSPPEESVDITRFGWEFKDGIPIPVIDHSDSAPSELIDIIKCQCKAARHRVRCAAVNFLVATKSEFRVHNTVIVQAKRDVVIHLRSGKILW